jgi:hypothetical protein
VILRIIHLEPGRYHRWNRASTAVCGLDDRSSCPRTSPSQLTPTEVADIKDMVLAPEHRHMPLGTLARYAQRIGKVFASATTWAKLDSLVKSHFPDFRPNDSAHLESRFWPIWGFLRESQACAPAWLAAPTSTPPSAQAHRRCSRFAAK